MAEAGVVTTNTPHLRYAQLSRADMASSTSPTIERLDQLASDTSRS